MKQMFFAIISVYFFTACTQPLSTKLENKMQRSSSAVETFFYSTRFAERFNIKKGNLMSDWQGVIAVAIGREGSGLGASCYVKLYLGRDINFDYPQSGDFVNISGERYDEIFSFTSDISDADAQLHAQLIFKSANKIAVYGFENGEVSASAGFNIDYIMSNAAEGLTYVKTQKTLCAALKDKRYKYYLHLKPKGIDRNEEFMKYYLSINK